MIRNREENDVQTATDLQGEIRLCPAGQACYLLPSWYGITGFKLEDGRNAPLLITRIVHPDDLPLFEAHLIKSGEKHLPGKIEFRIIRPDGEVRWIGHACVPAFDENGQYTGARGGNWDITERREADEIIKAQGELGDALVKSLSLNEALQLCLKAAVKVSGLDAGSIFIREESTGDLNLFFSEGIADEYVRNNSHYSANSRAAKAVAAGKPFYLNKQLILSLHDSNLIEERMRSIAIIPFFDKGEIIGSLHLISYIHNEMPDRSRYALETIARYIGAAIARAQAEQNLKISEEKYRALFENAVEGIFQTTPDGQILSVNPAMVNLSGYDSQEDLMHNVANVIQIYANPDDRLSFRKEIEEKGSVNKYEVLCVRKDGQKIWIAVNARAIRDQDGHINHYDGFFEDITERKKMGDDLRRSEERLRAIVDTSNAGIIMMTIDGHILFANQQMGKMLGCTVEALIGTDYNAYVHPEDCESVADNISRLQGSNVNQLYTQRRYICRDSIERWGYVSIGRIEIGPGEYHAVLVISDITEFRKVEKEKKLLEDYLRQAQKMEAIGTLAGGVAHDFNNILASMMGFTEMGIRETRQDIRRDYLEQVLQACERAKNLVNQILAFSRMREQERHPVNLRLILQEVVGLLRASLPATIEIKQDITQKETYVLADPTQIHQIVMNLCTNAAHAMREKGGVLAIHLGNIEIQHPTPVAPSDLPMGSYVQLSVRDTGHGIDDAVKDKIFDPFFTTKQAREGTGLGLSVVYGIVKSSGGSIKVQSTAGEGATFTIFLPRIRSENQSEETCQDDVDLRGHERILFVDDEEMLVKMAILFFEPLGYEITATTSSPEALRLFQENPGAFDLVITDMTMPQTTGIELSRALLKIRPELPIILCTGYSDSVNAAEARKLKIRELVLKPVSLTVLGRLVRQVLKS